MQKFRGGENTVASEDRLRELEEKYEDYKVYDNQGSKIGKVDDLFIDDADHEEYIGVKMGLFGMRSTLIPMELVRVNEQDHAIEVSETKDHVKDAPNFDDDDDITKEFEERIRTHFGLGSSVPSSRGGYGASSTGATAEETRGRESAQKEDTDEQPAVSSGSGEHRGSGDHGEDRGASSASGYDATEHRDYDHAQSSESEGAASGEAETQNAPQTRQTEETETFEEGGRTKIRRRTIREEVEDVGQDTDRGQ